MAHPLAFSAFIRHCGGSADRLFRRQGLPALCDEPDVFVPLNKAWGFFNSSAQSLDPMLGWHVGRFVGEQNLNRSLLRKIETAPTLFLALQRLKGLAGAEASHLQLGIRERRDDILLYTHYPDMKGEPGYNSSQSYQFGVYINVIRSFAGKDWAPDEIGVEYPVVPPIAEKLYPRTRIIPKQPFGYLAIPRSCLHLPPLPGDLGGDGDEVPIRADHLTYNDTLSALLKPYLPEGYPDMSLAADLMGISARTLARRLSDSGTSYRALVDHLRFESNCSPTPMPK